MDTPENIAALAAQDATYIEALEAVLSMAEQHTTLDTATKWDAINIVRARVERDFPST